MKKWLCWMLMAMLIPTLACQKQSETEQASATTENSFLKAMDEYHRVLRPLMHQALPNQDVAAFKANASALLQCAETVATTDIPEKFAAQKAQIDSLADAMLAKTRLFYDACQGGADAEMFNQFSAAHEDYEALADIVYKL
ncbi:MAG TPA: hypothetical protein VGA99_01345 [bacterium]